MPFVNKDLPCAKAPHKASHRCSRCNRTFTKEGLIQHLQHSSKHSNRLFPESCVRCVRSFPDTKALIQHLNNNRHHLNDLHQAACSGRFQLVDQLMRNEYADWPGDSHLPSKSQTGFTPMHCAAFGGHYECLKIMLSWPDGRPNVVDPKDGRTPVHLAAWRGHGNCLKLLLRKGGDLNVPDNEGNTPLDLTWDSSCLSIILFHLADKNTWFQASDSQPTEQDLKTVKLVWNRLYGENSFEQTFGVASEACNVEEISATTQVVFQVKKIAPTTEEPCSEPYEVLSRGEVAVSIFNKALLEGKAQVTRMQLTFIGDIGAGKTSLVRTLSGEEFVEERQETHGINTSMVEMTELDDSWHATDLNKSHVDEILADKVCEGIKNSPTNEKEQSSRALQLSLSDPGSTRGHRSYGIRRLPSIEYAPESAESSSSDQANGHSPVSRVNLIGRSSSVQTAPRDIPVEQIVRKLSEASLDDDKPRKYTKITIWDFAGHPLYQVMHHVFLNRRSFYLVVTNLAQLCNPESRDQAIEKLHFWLNSVRVHTPQSSSVFLVGTHRDQVTLEDISRAERALYDEFLGGFGQQLVRSQENSFLFAVDNTLGAEDDGAVLLKKTIEKEASRRMLMDEEFPVLWLHCEEEILKRREDKDCPACVPKDVLKAMIQRNFSVVDETFDSMLHFFHDSGVIILPEELLGPETQKTQMNDLVVINPQYLVNVMTCLHDIPELIDVDRQHCTKWKALQDRGITDIGFLEHVWKDFNSSVTDLVGMLEACGMLCPISTMPEAEDPEDREGMGPGITRYIVPIHLKKKCLKRKWERLCRKTWDGICTSDKVLIFDFLNFLPPALFTYFIVRTGAKSKTSNGMKPIVAKEMAIFSFGDSFFVLTEACQKYNQIKVSARHKNGKKLHELFTIVMSIMTDICQRQFKFLKFSFGPVCPNPRCPGADCDGKVSSPIDASSDESEGEAEGNSTCDKADDRHPEDGGRCHVIPIDPALWSRPLWCNATPVHQFEEIRQWFVKETVCKVPEDSPCYSMKVASCCHVIVAKEIANKWKWLGRALGVDETTIDNIQSENETQDERSYQVIRRWLQHPKSHRATVHFLMKALEDVEVVDAMETFDRHLADRHAEETSKDR